jgi:isopenicillin-N epimerase
MREYFQVNPEIIYLNSGTHSLVPQAVLKAQQNYQFEFEKNPTAGLFRAWGNLWQVQKQVASFFEADPKSLFLRTNVTQPLNEFILGMPLSPGSEILTTSQEYGAVHNICRFRCKRDGLELRLIHLPNRLEAAACTTDDYLDRVISAIKPQTKMLVLSEIFTGHGLVLPIKEIAKETRRRGVLLIVDGAHSPGSLPLDFGDLQDVDFYGGNLHKWFMGPKGTGFGWVHDRHKESLQPLQAGWTTFETFEPFNSFGEGDRFAVRMMMLGCHDFASFYALKETVEFWRQRGPEKIFGRINLLAQHLIKQADRLLKMPRFSTEDSRLRGPLHAYLLPKKYQDQSSWGLMEQILQDTKVQVSVTTIENEQYLRLSSHVYNSEEELNEGLDRLARFFNK